MKAKEYFVKYADGIKSFDPTVSSAAIGEMVTEMLKEVQEIAKTRHCSLDRGMISILKEQTQKYNAVVNMFNPPVLVKDGFKTIVLSKLLPEAAAMWN